MFQLQQYGLPILCGGEKERATRGCVYEDTQMLFYLCDFHQEHWRIEDGEETVSVELESHSTLEAQTLLLPEHVTVLLTTFWLMELCKMLLTIVRTRKGQTVSSGTFRGRRGSGHFQMQKQKYEVLCLSSKHRVNTSRKLDRSRERTRMQFNILGVTNIF